MYDWGIKGKDGSLVAEFGTATEQLQLRLEDHVPYAEVSSPSSYAGGLEHLLIRIAALSALDGHSSESSVKNCDSTV